MLLAVLMAYVLSLVFVCTYRTSSSLQLEVDAAVMATMSNHLVPSMSLAGESSSLALMTVLFAVGVDTR